MLEALEDLLVFVELALLDRDVDADNVLPDDAASADVQVTGEINEPRKRVETRD